MYQFFSYNYVEKVHVLEGDEAIYHSPMLQKGKTNLTPTCRDVLYTMNFLMMSELRSEVRV